MAGRGEGRTKMIKSAGKHERKQRARARAREATSPPTIRKGQQFPRLQLISEFSYTCTPTRSSFLGAAPRRIEEQRALRYFWDGERMMAMPDLGGRDPLGSAIPTTKQAPTRFQECVIFHFLLTGNRPKRAENRTDWRGRGRRASLSGGAALKEFRDSCALWRPLHHSSRPLSALLPTMSNRAIMLAERAHSLGG